MFKKSGIISLALSAVMFFSVALPASAESSSSCTDCSSSIVYSNEQTGNQVVEIQKDGQSHYAAVSSPFVNDQYDETRLEKMKQITEDLNAEAPIDTKEPIVLERVYFQFEQSLEDAIATANTPVPVESSDLAGQLAKSGFWKGSWIEKIWDWWYGTGYNVHISSGDANYIITVGSVVVTALFGILAAASIISTGAAVAVPAIIVIGILTLYQTIRNDDGSVDFEMYEPNLNVAVCVASSQYIGQARNKGTFRNFFWPVYWPGYCFP